MVNFGSILVPLYIYPLPASKWDPLVNIAKQYPQVNFTAVINPDNGPGRVDSGCPNNDYVGPIAALNALPNVATMGYVHTANRYNCGPSKNWICPATQPIDDVKANITRYANWKKLKCAGWGTTNVDVHMDSIFIDEAPNQDGGANLTYMANLTSFARSSGFNASNQGIVLFNPGGPTDLSYFKVADQIIILEDSQANYDKIADIDERNGNGTYYAKTSIIIHTVTATAAQIQNYVQELLGLSQDAFPSLFMASLPNATQSNPYGNFSNIWPTFVSAVNNTVYSNKAYCKTNSC